MKAKKLFLMTSFIVGCLFSAYAQGSFEDDIYYNPAKDTKAKLEKKAKALNQPVTQSNYNYSIGGHDYNGADTYVVNSGNGRDVDEYNRRTGDHNGQSVNNGSQSQDDFTYTRRIEKYHNGNIISDLNDPDLVEYYYATSQPEVNVYINYPGSAWYNPWYSPWAYDPWYSPWYWNNWYGPSWSWSWGWGPSWAWGPSWSWGLGPSWAWGPSWGWGPGWGPSWGWGPGWAWTSRGDYAPNGRRPVGVRNGYTGLGSHRVNGNTGLGGNRGYNNGSVGNFRPGSGSSGNYRPGGNTNNAGRPVYVPSNNNNNNSNNGYNRTTGNRNNRNNNTYNNYNNSTNRNNGSFSNPSRGSGNTGGFGGSRGGGGGGGSHRGGRR